MVCVWMARRAARHLHDQQPDDAQRVSIRLPPPPGELHPAAACVRGTVRAERALLVAHVERAAVRRVQRERIDPAVDVVQHLGRAEPRVEHELPPILRAPHADAFIGRAGDQRAVGVHRVRHRAAVRA